MKKKQTYKIIKRVILCLLIPISILLVSEVILYFQNYNFNVKQDSFRLNVAGELLTEYDKILFWKPKGKNPSFNKNSSKKLLKIMCLTDSVSVMQKYSYPIILQKLLRKSYQNKLKVFNAGVPGYTSYQGLKYFKTELLSYNPDIIIVCFGWNDHYQSHNHIPDCRQDPPSENLLSLINKSRTLSFLYSLVLKIKQSNYKRTGANKYRRVPIKNYKNNLTKFTKISKKKNIFIILMTAPYLKPENNENELILETHKRYNQVVRNLSQKYEIPLVDKVKEFKKRKNLFLNPQNDICHYNKKGSNIIAKALKEIIVNEFIE